MTSKNTPGDFDVIVAGAGPTGLLLAIELTLGGARPVVLERLAEPDETIKAGGLGALAAEALERRGMKPAMDAEEAAMVEGMKAMMKTVGADNPVLAGGIGKVGGHFAGLFLIDQSRQREPHRRFRGVRQQALEHMLGERARAMGVEIRRRHSLVDFEDDGEGVTASVEGEGGSARLRAGWLVGCDGGRSFVRKRAGFAFPGTDPTITGRQAIVELDHPERLLPLGWRRTPRGMMAFGPVPGRVFLAEFDGPPADREAPVTAQEIEDSLRRVSGADVRVLALRSGTRFTDNARQATSYRRGRVLLAGDAAHVHSPFGGQGLNLGLMDAANLGWKLAAQAKGWAPHDLLDSYSAERHPVGSRVLENTRAQLALMRPDPLTTPLRQIVSDLMMTDDSNRFFGEMMSGIRTRYDLGDATPEVGTSCADRRLDGPGPSTLFEAMQAGGAILVDGGDDELRQLGSRWSTRVRVVHGASAMLVRPDGCIAWMGHPDQAGRAGLTAALQRWCGNSDF